MSSNMRRALDEMRKLAGQQGKGNNTKMGSNKASVDEALNANRAYHASGVDESYINTFLNDSNNFLTQAQTDWDNLSWESATNSDSAKAREKNASSLNYRKSNIRAWLTLNKDSIDEDIYNQFTSYLDGVDYGGVVNQFKKASDVYSRFEGQEHYDVYAKSIEEIQAELDKGNRIAYTTKDGQNIMWQDLYDEKWNDHDVEANYNEYSSRADWDEMSKGFLNTGGEYNDYQIMWQIVYDAGPDTEQKKKNRQYIADKYGIDFSNEEKAKEDLSALMNDQYMNNENYLLVYDLDSMTDKEKELLYYISNLYGREAAENWYRQRENVIYKRDIYDTILKNQAFGEEHPFWGSLASIGTNLLAAGESAAELLNTAVTGEPSGKYNENALITSALRSGAMKTADWNVNLFGKNWDAFDFLYGTGMSMADSVVSQYFGGGFTQGLSAGGQAMNDALDRGATDEGAFWTGVAAGTAEGIFENFSIGKFKALKEMPVSSLKQLGKNIGKSILVNATEEMATEFSNILTDRIINGDASQWETTYRQYLANGCDPETASWNTFWDHAGQVAEAGASGALMGVGFGVAGSSGNAINFARAANKDNRRTKALAKTIVGTEGGTNALLGLGNKLAGESSGRTKKNLEKQIGNVKSGATAKNVGKLYKAVGTAMSAQNKADIVKSLERKGISSKEAGRIADAIIALNRYNGITANDANSFVDEIITLTYGNDLSKRQQKAIEDSGVADAVAAALNDIVVNEKSTMGQRSQKIDNLVYNVAEEMVKTEFLKQSAEKEFAPKGEYDVSAEGKAMRKGTDELLDIKGVASIRKGELLLDIGDGKTISAKDVVYANSNDALIYESIANLGDNINAEVANQLIAKFDGGNAEVFARGIAQAYTYGFYGIDSSELMGKKSLASELTEEQRNEAYDLGRKYRPTKDLADKAAARVSKAPAEKGVYYRGKDGKATDISTYLKESGIKLNDAQKTGIEAMRKLSAALGVRFNVYETWVENGKHFYLDENGDKVEGNPNGFYDTRTGEIYIDLRAGNNYEGTILFTVAHELTHFMRQWSPEHFTKIASIVFKHGGMKGNVSELVALKQKKAADKGKPISYDTALEEVVADGMETILKDGKVVEFMAEVKQKDHVAWQKIKAWFKNLAKFLRKMVWAYKGQSAQTTEGAKVAEFSENLLRQIEQIWAEGAVEAGDAYRAAQEQFSTDAIRGNADGAVVQSEVTEALVEASKDDSLKSERTEYEALPKQMMSLSTGAGTLLHYIEGLTPTKVKGISGKTINGYTGRDVRAYAMGISGFTQAQIQRVNKFMDAMSDFMEEAGVTYKFIGLQDVKDAQLHYTYNADGSIKSIVLSAMVKNGDYPVNFDLSSICKKRVAMSKLIDKLAKRGSLDNGTVKLTPANIFKINTALKNAGYETACLGCFVESKRYNSLEWAKKFCNKWNAAVKKVNPNATYFGYGDASFNEDSFTLEQAVKIDEAATKYITTTKTERLANALAKYKAKEEAGLPLVESFSKAALDRLRKSDTISDELKAKYLNCDVSTLNMADVEFLLENGILPGATLSNKQAVTEMVKSGEAYQHLLRPSDLLTDRGISKLEALPNFHGVLYGHYGSGTPKLMQSYTPYNSEIALLPANKNSDQTLAEYLYTIAGVRMQSFSDFQIQNIYDYLQMVGDLAARKVPAHAYTKEISFAKLLGMTGIKCNLSVMFDIDPTVDKAHAGLTKLNKLVHRGEYAKVVLEDEQGRWVYNIGDYQTQKLFAEAYPDEAKRFLQSIGFGDAVKLQATPGYSANCGIIGVGYSDLGIFAMLDDNRIRYIIPYHASSLPAEIKLATNIALGTDYTPYQNNMKIKEIVDRNGNKVNWTIKEAYKRLGSGQTVINELNEKIRSEGWVVSTTKAQNGHGSYGLYEDLRQTSDPRQTASNFMDWCIGNGTLPLFYQFASHENYYKMLYDFNVYDCVTEEYAPQQAVANTYPTMVDGQVQAGNVTDGNFDVEYLQGAIDKQMAFMNEYSRNLDEDLESMADNMESSKFSYRGTNKDGIEVYETSKAIMNLSWADRRAKYLDVMRNVYHGRTAKFGRNGHVYYARFDQSSIRKHIFGDKRSSPNGVKALIKAGADGDVFDLVEKSRYTGSQRNKKNHTNADYFDYFVKTVQIDGKVFDLMADVEKTYGVDGGYVYTLALVDNNKIKASPALGTPTSGPVNNAGNASGTKVTQPAGKVNNNNSTPHSDRDADYLAAVNRGDMKLAQKMVDEAAKAAGYPIKAYHGTPAKFTKFDTDIIYFTANKNHAAEYGENVLELYVKADKPYISKDGVIVGEDGEPFLDGGEEVTVGWLDSVPEAYDYLVSKGYDAAWDEDMEFAAVFSAANVKSADPVTYDDDGNVIPLSQRFNAENEDIRYSDRDSDGTNLTEDQMEFFENSKARDENGNLYVLYHGSRSPLFTEFDMYEGVWLTPDQRYAEVYAEMWHTWREETQERSGLEQSVYADPDYRLYKMYANITNPMDIGEINDDFDRKQLIRLARLLGVPASQIKNLAYDEYGNETIAFVYQLTKQKEFIDIAREKGFDGFVATEKGKKTFCAFNAPNQVKLTTNAVPSTFNDIRYQNRDTDSVSNRSLLANAFEGMAQNDIERNKIQEYKSKVSLIDAEEKKLRELNEQIKELSFSKGPRDTKKINGLRIEANKVANRINTYDKQLLRLEASKPLQDVLTREKKKAYKKAEQKGKEALAAQREKAAKTQREMIEKWQESRKKAVESREKTAMRHKIQRVVGELNDLLLSNDKKRHVPENLKKAVAEALALVNMDTVGAEERAAKYAALIEQETDPDKIDAYTMKMENILRQGEKMGQRLKELRDAYEEISESDDPDIANAYDPVIAGSLKELAASVGNTSLRNMTIDQLQDVYDMYKMVLTRVRDANKAFLNARNESISNLASRVVGEVRRIRGERKYRVAMLDAARAFSWNNLKPVYAMERIGSGTLAEAFSNVRAGEDTWAKDVGEAKAYYLDKSKKYGYDSWDFNKKYTFESTSGVQFELTLEQIMSLYAYSKREQSLDHLRLGGFVFDSNIETYKEGKLFKRIVKYKVNTAEAHQISAEILANITGTLSKEQRSFVDDMQEYLSTVMGAKGNEVTMKMYGVKLFKEKFYFPLKSAKQFLFEQNQVAGEVKIKNAGFTNKVVAHANNPVILNSFMDVWSDHVNDMSMYHSFVLPLEDFNRIFNYKSPKKEGQPPVSVKGTIQGAYSPAAVDYVKQLITDLNGGARSDPRETLGKKLVALFKKAKVFTSLSVVIQQPSAIGRAYALVDPKYFRPTKDGMNHGQLWEELKSYAPVAVIKEMGYFDTDMGLSTRDYIKAKEYSGFKEKVKGFVKDGSYRDEVMSRLPAWADEVTWCAIWNAVKRETVSTHKDLRPGSEEFLKAAGKRFTEVITKTQVYDSVLARSANMRSKGGLMSMVTSFMAEPTTTINMLEDAILKSKRGDKKYARRAFASVAVAIILNNALASIIYAMRDDDEDETILEKYAQAFVSGMLDDINPLTYYPFVKDIWSLFQGYDIERADMSLVSDLADAAQGLITAYTSEDGDVAGAWWDLTGTVANLFGIPMDNIRRDVKGVINAINTITEDVNGRATTWGSMGDSLQATVQNSIPVWGWFPDETKSDKLYDAIINGDTAYVNRLRESYKDEDAYNSSAKTELKELYLAGKISDSKVVNALVTYCDMDETEAELLVESYVWEKQGYEGVTSAAVRDYNTYCASLAVPKDVYLHIRSFSNNTENDKDANGKTINYSAMKKVIAEIDAQRGLSSTQKTAIARSLGWSDKNINKYKTW